MNQKRFDSHCAKALFAINGEPFIKKFEQVGKHAYMVPLNEKYPPRELHDGLEFRVLGPVVGWRRACHTPILSEGRNEFG